MASDGTGKFQLYHYDPSIAGAAIFIVLFSAASIAHVVSMVRFRSWYFIPFILGGLFEVFGYGLRISGNFYRESVGAFAGQSVLLLVAPPLFAATIYMILARIIRALDAASLSLIPLRWLTTIFVTSDVICFFVQGGGGGIQATGNPQNLETGKWVVTGGLILQVIVFCVFVATAWNFHVRFSNRGCSSPLPWKRQMGALYIASGLILLRNIVRIVEFVQGFDGYIMTHEVFIFVFDAVPMFFVMVTMFWVHAGQFLHQAARMGRQQEWTAPKGSNNEMAHAIV